MAKVLALYEQPDEHGQKPEYAGIICWYFKKRMKRK